MSDYEPFYLEWWTEKDLKEGTLEDKYVKCEVCEEIRRNVIEPAVVFIKKNDNQTKNQVEQIQQNSEELKNFLKDFYKSIKGKTDNKPVCIFHCQKENEIWMENYEDYEEYSKRRDEAIKKKEPFDEDFEIKWNEDLVKEFWNQARIYKILIENEFKNNDQYLNTLKEKEKNKLQLFSFYFNYQLRIQVEIDFERTIFPKFDTFRDIFFWEISNIDLKNPFDEEYNFWFKNEKRIFIEYVNFEESNFLDNTFFHGVSFKDGANFMKAIFNKFTLFFHVNFEERLSFFNSIFSKKLYFENVLVESELDFERAKFNKGINFKGVEFKNKVSFKETLFEGDTYFSLKGNNKKFDISKIYLKDNAYIEIRDLKTNQLIIKNNLAKNFTFFNLTLLSEGQRDFDLKNLEIKNSMLNNMRFINCDFSEAKNIHIEDSSLTDIELINVEWGDISEDRICKNLFEKNNEENGNDRKKEKKDDKEKEEIKNYRKARSIYRQLKLALDKQEDHITANEFYALEMRAYEKELQSKSWKNYFQEKLVFKFHKWASNFGQSWIRPLVWIIFITSLVALYFHWNEINIRILYDENLFLNYSQLWDSLGTIIESFFATLNVLKIFGNLSNNCNPKISFYYTVSSFYTMSLAFLIYQFIVAVRRKVKR